MLCQSKKSFASAIDERQSPGFTMCGFGMVCARDPDPRERGEATILDLGVPHLRACASSFDFLEKRISRAGEGGENDLNVARLRLPRHGGASFERDAGRGRDIEGSRPIGRT